MRTASPSRSAQPSAGRLFTAAKALGLPVRLHTEQISNIGGSRMAAQHGALACDHLEYTTRGRRDRARAGRHRGGDAAGRVVRPRGSAVAADRPAARARRADGGGERRQSGLGAGRFAADGDAHGATVVRHDSSRGARRCHAPRGARAGPCRHARPDRRPDIAPTLPLWSVGSLDELGYWIGFNPCSMVVRHGEIVLERDA